LHDLVVVIVIITSYDAVVVLVETTFSVPSAPNGARRSTTHQVSDPANQLIQPLAFALRRPRNGGGTAAAAGSGCGGRGG